VLRLHFVALKRLEGLVSRWRARIGRQLMWIAESGDIFSGDYTHPQFRTAIRYRHNGSPQHAARTGREGRGNRGAQRMIPVFGFPLGPPAIARRAAACASDRQHRAILSH
jgi:hypothetical protein